MTKKNKLFYLTNINSNLKVCLEILIYFLLRLTILKQAEDSDDIWLSTCLSQFLEF